MPNKPTFAAYQRAWSKAKIGVSLRDASQQGNYETNAGTALAAVRNHAFIQGLESCLKSADAEFQRLHGTKLLRETSAPTLVSKPYMSAVDKSYRHDVVNNTSFPKPAAKKWLKPEDWFEKFNDIVRGEIICRFMDGPEFLARHLKKLAARHGVTMLVEPKHRDSGYYAYHVYVLVPVRLFVGGVSRSVNLSVEIQLATQLQDALRSLTHEAYEKARKSVDDGSTNWKWDFETLRFKSSYLGHTLHLLEGLLVSLRAEALTPQKTATSKNARG